MKTKKIHQHVKHVKHVLPSEDRRAERRTRTVLKRARCIEDWDAEEIQSTEHRYRKRQDLE